MTFDFDFDFSFLFSLFFYVFEFLMDLDDNGKKIENIWKSPVPWGDCIIKFHNEESDIYFCFYN